MGLSLQRLTHLYLSIRLLLHNNLSSVDKPYDSNFKDDKYSSAYTVGKSSMHIVQLQDDLNLGQNTVSCCPANVALIPRKVLEMMSAAAPNLQHLSLLGLCSDSTLHAVGSNCKQLQSLTVEASSVHSAALHNLHLFLPGLRHVKLMRRGERGNNLKAAVTSYVAALGACASLTSLDLDVGPKVEVSCADAGWLLLPASLIHLRCTGSIPGVRRLAYRFQTLTHMDLVSSPFTDLVELMRSAPCLEQISVQNVNKLAMVFDSTKLQEPDGSPSSDVEPLLQRLARMRISCPELHVKAFSAQVCEMFSWMQPITTAKSVTINLRSPEVINPAFLRQVARVFPSISAFKLADVDPKRSPPMIVFDLSENCLVPLLECVALKSLCLEMHISLTLPAFSQLCLGMPALETVAYYASVDWKRTELLDILRTEKPKIKVNLLADKMQMPMQGLHL